MTTIASPDEPRPADVPASPAWSRGQVVVRREVLNDGRAWLEFPVFVVQDDADLLVMYIAPGAPFTFPAGPWPTADGLHPWSGRSAWSGHGTLMLQRPGDMHAIWVFWEGPERRFSCWYVNIQEPFRRTELGYDTQDLELDVVVAPDGSWFLKDDDALEQRVAEGRFSSQQVARVRREGRRITSALELGDRWWSEGWAGWRPAPSWDAAFAPDGR